MQEGYLGKPKDRKPETRKAWLNRMVPILEEAIRQMREELEQVSFDIEQKGLWSSDSASIDKKGRLMVNLARAKKDLAEIYKERAAINRGK